MNKHELGKQVYFDCNATTPVLPLAMEAALNTMQTLYGNPSSTHFSGIQAKYILETARKAAAQAVGAQPEQIIFSSGATETIQTAVFSVLQSIKNNPNLKEYKILYGATEHKAVPQAIHHWVKTLDLPLQIQEIPVDSEGQIQIEFLKKELPKTVLFCTMAVNNETGAIQDLKKIESLLTETQSSALWIVDCVQALGKLPLSLEKSRIQYAFFSGHKLYAPKGVGFLYVKKDAPYTPLVVGGGQEKGLRSGTENLPGIAALGAVLNELLLGEKSTVFLPEAKLKEFREKLISKLKGAFPKVVFNTPFEKAVPTTINFSVPGLSSKELLEVFDSVGIRMSSGSACNSTSLQPSHVLTAMGFSIERSSSALRLSFGPHTASREIDLGCEMIQECGEALQAVCISSEIPQSEKALLKDGILQFRAGPTNSWLITHANSRRCIVVDPCEDIVSRLEKYIRCQNLEVLAVLDTHSHADHESVRPSLQSNLIKLNLLKKSNFDSLGWPTNLPVEQVILDDQSRTPVLKLSSDSEESLGLTWVATPGHTKDSRTFILGKVINGSLKKKNVIAAFPGDMILSGGLGRTNFSSSSTQDLYSSLQKINSIVNPMTLFCPAHDYNYSFATCLKIEAQENPLLALAIGPQSPLNLETFIKKKESIDQDLLELEENFQGLVCGVTESSNRNKTEQVTIPYSQFSKFLSENRSSDLIILDVRESHEFALFRNWKKLGFKKSPINVPLSHLVNYISALLTENKFDQEILCICRSGNRSLQATQALRRLGFSHAWNLEGGLALLSQSNSN